MSSPRSSKHPAGCNTAIRRTCDSVSSSGLLSIILASILTGHASGHGFLIHPPARQKGASDFSTAGTVCAYCSCCWFTNGAKIPGKPTICDKNLVTSSMSKSDQLCGSRDWTKAKPWRAPGTAAITSPCGRNNGRQDGRALAPRSRVRWLSGGVAEVAHSITANHGGGYAVRLCPSSLMPKEECFQAHTLRFATNCTTVRFVNGSTIHIPATRTSKGTHPTGSEWTKNPIPASAGYFPSPFEGAVGSKWEFSLVDQVVVPPELPPGEYTLSWRWDCELTSQVWTNCGDISITADVSPLLH